MESIEGRNSSQIQPVQHHSLLVEFKVQCTLTKPGETVRVTGSCNELGNWIPKDGMKLKTTPAQFPIWDGSTLIKL